MINQAVWADFITSRQEANFLQSLEWAATNQAVGHTIIRGGVDQNDTLTAGWQGIIKNARRGRYLEVPGGPLADYSEPSLVNEITKQLRAAAKQHRCAFVRIRPQLVDTSVHRQLLTETGFKEAPFHLHAEHTNILDITPSEDEIMAGMRRQTRYEIRAGYKKDISVSWQSGVAAATEFFEVQAETAKRQGFVPPTKRLLEAQMTAFGDKARIYRAEKDGVLLNLALVLFFGEEADYFEAASTPDSRQYPGAYAVQWQAIRDARDMGKTRYNFWGIAASDDPTHRYAGVTTFKRGFGGQDVSYVPAYDLVIDNLRYSKNWLIETMRKKRRKL